MSNQKLHVKKGDNVYVLSGKDQDRRGRILKVFPGDGRVLVEGVNMVTKHKKPRQTNPGGIINQEAPVHVSNVMLVCEKCRVPTKVGRQVLDNGEKVRICKKCGAAMDKKIESVKAKKDKKEKEKAEKKAKKESAKKEKAEKKAKKPTETKDAE